MTASRHYLARRRLWGWAARALALLLVPVIIVSTPGVGNAATKYGDVVTFDLDARSFVGDGLICNTSAYFVNEDVSSNNPLIKWRVKINCSETGPDWFVNYQNLDVWVVAGGGGCDQKVRFTDPDGHNGTTQTETSAGVIWFGLNGISGGPEDDCGPATDVCWSVHLDNTAAPDEDREGCAGQAPGAPPQSSGGAGMQGVCTLDDAEVPYPDAPPFYDSAARYWKQTWVFPVPQTPDTDAPAGWYVYLMGKHDNVGGNWASNGNVPGYKYVLSTWGTAPFTGQFVVTIRMGPTGTAQEPGQLTDVVKGAGLMARYHTSFPNGAQLAQAQALPQATGSGRLGVTNGSQCAFYWGEKVADTTDNTDEPIGPITETSTGSDVEPGDPMAGDSASCDWDWTDPASWASSAACYIVSILGQILGVLRSIAGYLAGLASAIASAIVGALTDLFVPDPDFLGDALSDVSDAFEDTTLGQWVDEFSSARPASASAGGCAGPTFDVDVMGKGMSAQPLNACGGMMATIAGIVKAVIAATVVWFGGLACIRAIGSGFGWNPGVGQ